MLNAHEFNALELLIADGAAFERDCCTSHIAKKLASRGLVTRQKDRPGRPTVLVITDSGRQAFDAAKTVRMREAVDIASAR